MDSQMSSQPQYGMIVEKDVMVTARDGVKLAVDVYRPDAPGAFPGLFTISVYGKDTQFYPTPQQEFGGSIFERPPSRPGTSVLSPGAAQHM